MDRTKQMYYRAKMKAAQKQLKRVEIRRAAIQKSFLAKIGGLDAEEQMYREDLTEAEKMLQPSIPGLDPESIDDNSEPTES